LVQTTLLGLGIAVILALLAALVGPIFVDWGQYRDVIEAEAGRIIGAPVRVAGPIDVRLLPTPSLSLGEVNLAPAGNGGGAAQNLAARSLAMDFGLGTLIRGEFRANQVTIDGLDLTIGLDRFGNIETAANLGFDPDRLAIDRLTIEGGHITLTDAASGGRLAVDDVNLKGEVRSLIGPFKAEGTFAAEGEHFGYRLSGSRRGEDGGMRLRLALDSTERALAFESDGTLWVEAGSPRYEGTATLTRVVGTALPSGEVAINDPWKIASKVKVTAANARLDQLDLQYGPDVRSVHLTGSATMDFGRAPRVATALTARQIDLDRMLGAAAPKRLPFEAVKSMAERLAALMPPQLPIRIGLGVDSLTVGGATLNAVRSDIASASGGWNIDTLDLRAPGTTLMHVAGTLGAADGKVEFKGPVKVDSSDPAVFFAWIEGRSAAGRAALGPMRAGGTITLGSERVAVDELAAEIDRKPLEGRLSYRFATPAMPARLDATLSAADLDLDRTLSVGSALFASTSFTPPGEMALALDIGRATYAGVEARKAQAVLVFDRSGLKIERASIVDLGGASIEASGGIGPLPFPPPQAGEAERGPSRGSIAISLAAPRLDGVTAVAEKFLPQAADPLRKYGARVAPLRVNAKLDVAPQPGKAAQAQSTVKLKLDGKVAGTGAGGIDLNLEASAVGDMADPAAATLKLDGRLDAIEARALAALIGLDALANADTRPARVTFSVNGAAGRGFQVDGKFSGNNSVAASAVGTLDSTGRSMLEATLRAVDSQLPRRDSSVPLPVDVRTRLALFGSTVDIEDVYGKVAGVPLRGRLTLGLDQPMKIDGRIAVQQEVDAGEVIALLTGTPRAAAAAAGAAAARAQPAEWPAEPFAQPVIPALNGRVEFRIVTARWPAGLLARDFAGAVRFEPSGFSLDDVTGTLAGGRLSFDAQVRRESMGIALHSHVKLVNADVPALFAGALRAPAAGRISLDTEVQGQGLSPASLVGALTGTGTLTAERLELAGLDPTAVDAVIRAMDNDRGLGANPGRIAEIASAGLDVGRLRVPSVTAPIVIADGRAQVVASASAQNTEIAGPVSLGLNDGQIDARLTMTGPARKNAAGSERPAMAVAIRGPLGTARRSVDIAPIVNWVTMQRVEEEAKRLDAAEKERKRLDAAAEAIRRQQDAPKDGSKPESGSAPPAPAQASTVGRAPDAAPAGDVKPSPPASPLPRRTQPPPGQQRPPGLMDLLQPGR
jgi:large subunit ribosomal protein L24